MMVTKYVIRMKIPTRPDLDYYYVGQTKEENSPLFDYRRPRAKKYNHIEEAYRDMQILSAVSHNETLDVIPVKAKA